MRALSSPTFAHRWRKRELYVSEKRRRRFSAAEGHEAEMVGGWVNARVGWPLHLSQIPPKLHSSWRGSARAKKAAAPIVNRRCRTSVSFLHFLAPPRRGLSVGKGGKTCLEVKSCLFQVHITTGLNQQDRGGSCSAEIKLKTPERKI